MIKTVFLVLCAFGLFVWFNGESEKSCEMSLKKLYDAVGFKAFIVSVMEQEPETVE